MTFPVVLWIWTRAGENLFSMDEMHSLCFRQLVDLANNDSPRGPDDPKMFRKFDKWRGVPSGEGESESGREEYDGPGAARWSALRNTLKPRPRKRK